MISESKIAEIKKLITEKANELDEYINFEIKIACFGKVEIDEYPEDYPEDGEPILIDGEARVKFEVYRSSKGHEDFDNIEDAIRRIRRFRGVNPNQKHKHAMLIAQDKCANYEDNSY